MRCSVIDKCKCGGSKEDHEPECHYCRYATKMEARVAELEAFARNVATNYDHDEDAHTHGTPCRVCDAEALLNH